MRFFRYWNRFVTLGGILLSLLVCSLGLLFLTNLPLSFSEATNNAEMTVIPFSTYTSTPVQTSTDETTSNNSNQTSTGIQIGDYVQITGTNGEGLRIRSNPGLDSEINFIGMDSEVFLVQDGQQEADGYTWWYIAAPYDTSRNGWSASDFLTLIEQ